MLYIAMPRHQLARLTILPYRNSMSAWVFEPLWSIIKVDKAMLSSLLPIFGQVPPDRYIIQRHYQISNNDQENDSQYDDIG